MVEVKLPFTHAHDWFQRLGIDMGAEIVAETQRTITLRLTEQAATDLRKDAEFYAECMGPIDTGDRDYRPAARACLRHLEKAGL